MCKRRLTPTRSDCDADASGVSGPLWGERELANPHEATDKAGRVQRMFAAIARSYDLNNRLHSLWRDQAWRRAAVRMADPHPHEIVLDVACGTGDLARAFFARPWGQRPGRVLGCDFTFPMLQLAQRKASGGSRLSSGSAPRATRPGRGTFQRRRRQGAPPAPAYHAGDALRLPVADASVDIVSIAFGIRNVADPDAALGEFRRVLRPGGRVVILEFATPVNPVIRWLDAVYREKVMPRTATWIARDRSGAYRYLPRSVSTFCDPSAMVQLMRNAGFSDVIRKSLTFGVAMCYRGCVSSAAPDVPQDEHAESDYRR